MGSNRNNKASFYVWLVASLTLIRRTSHSLEWQCCRWDKSRWLERMALELLLPLDFPLKHTWPPYWSGESRIRPPTSNPNSLVDGDCVSKLTCFPWPHADWSSIYQWCINEDCEGQCNTPGSKCYRKLFPAVKHRPQSDSVLWNTDLSQHTDLKVTLGFDYPELKTFHTSVVSAYEEGLYSSFKSLC